MIRALYTAASGMAAQQMNLDNIANNLANSSTVGFQQRRVQFTDLLYQSATLPGAVRARSWSPGCSLPARSSGPVSSVRVNGRAMGGRAGLRATVLR